MFCKHCGAKVEKDIQFCPNCGTETLQSKTSSEISNNEYATPVAKAPTLTTLNGIGSKLYGDTIYFVLLFIPIFALGRYSVTNNKNGTYSFLGKLKLRRWQKIYNLIIAILIIVISIVIFGNGDSQTVSNTSAPAAPLTTAENQELDRIFNQNQIAGSVVNILCSDGTKEGGSGGSGTIWTTEGVILTNSHIIPQDKKGNPIPKYCIVTLPDPTTGRVKSIYYGKPIIVPILSEQYDLAAVSIEGAYVDEDGKSYGVFPTTFPSFFTTTSGCVNKNVRLREPVSIYGYPSISGGYSLTVTEGTVSSLPDKDFIVTSAKISHGNSGGLAVDENNCMVGIPEAVNSDGTESLGIIISYPTIDKFFDKYDALQKLMSD